jgi:hypothetical protein
MFALTGRPLLVLAVVGACAAVLAAVLVAVLGSRGSGRGRRLLLRGAPVLVLAVLAQGLAVLSFALDVNDRYAFYTSWADLTGHVTQGAAISTHDLVAPGEGRAVVMTVRHPSVGRDDQVIVWLPKQYDEPAYAHHRFPVMMFLAGQPSSPELAFTQFGFARDATQLIAAHEVPPFVAVLPTLMVSPPRDTECTDVPGGPAAETWLSTDVPHFMTTHFRTAARGRDWSVGGWSTGGFCAAKLVTSHPAWFSSAVSFGGYYQPITDHTTGSLFAGRRALKHHNSPQWLYGHLGGLHGSRLLLVAGRQDRESWLSTRKMLRASYLDPAVSSISFPDGGHNYRNYSAYLPQGMVWSARGWRP